MAQEIERKFLVDRAKLLLPDGAVSIRQGYIWTTDKTVVRVRIAGSRAYLALKGENKGIVRSEFEYEIPVPDAEKILSELCSGSVIEKKRYLLPHGDHTWEVDIFGGENKGLVVAEIELESENESFAKPDWLAIEVSGETRYYNSSLVQNPFQNWT